MMHNDWVVGGIPFTRAYVEPGSVYDDPDVINWIKSPQFLEKRFQNWHGKGGLINDSYVEDFQEDMEELLRQMDATNRPRGLHSIVQGLEYQDENTFTFVTQIFYVKILTNLPEHKVILKEIYLRPCAEKRGFFRMILFQLARYCAHNHCDMFVESPFQRTSSVLQKAFNPYLYTVDGLDEEDPEYYMVKREDCTRLDLGRCFGLTPSDPPKPNHDLLLSDSFNTVKYDQFNMVPPLKLNKSNTKAFPPASFLNYGPGPLTSDCWQTLAEPQTLSDTFDPQAEWLVQHMQSYLDLNHLPDIGLGSASNNISRLHSYLQFQEHSHQRDDALYSDLHKPGYLIRLGQDV